MCDSARHIPLSVPVVGEHERDYVGECLDTGWVSSAGEYVTRFEHDIREVTGASYAVACQSGTAALHLALQAVGVRQGDEVIVPSITFIATINPIAYVGAHPVFVDCDDFMNIDPQAVATFLEAECVRTDRGTVNRATGRVVSAMIPVHVFGNPCQMEALMGVADDWGIPVVEDAAESLGSRWNAGSLDGRHTGTVGTLGCLSFNGNKIITTGGGGMLLTENADMAEHCRHLSTQAKTDAVRFIHDEVGYNYRMTNVQAAIGVAQLESLSQRIAAKRVNHALYSELLEGVSGVRLLDVPAGTDPNYWFYSLLVEPDEYGLGREVLMHELGQRGVECRPVWYPNHMQEPYRGEQAWRIRRATYYWERVVNLPCTHTLEPDDIEYVCDAIRKLGATDASR